VIEGRNWGGIFLPHLRMETDPVSETLCFLVSKIPDGGQSPKTQKFWTKEKLRGRQEESFLTENKERKKYKKNMDQINGKKKKQK
jgi:hypothetical protein